MKNFLYIIEKENQWYRIKIKKIYSVLGYSFTCGWHDFTWVRDGFQIIEDLSEHRAKQRLFKQNGIIRKNGEWTTTYHSMKMNFIEYKDAK